MGGSTSFRIRTILGASLAGALALAAFSAGTADAAPSADTTTTFTVSGGSLDITAPAGPVDLGTGAAGSTTTIEGQLGTVQVIDTRAALAPTWTSSVSSTDFTTGGATPAETITAVNVRYWTGASTGQTGSGVAFSGGQPNAAASVTLDTPQNLWVLTAGVGNNTKSWNPTLRVAPPAAAVAGAYTGTVTHSVV